MAATCDVNVHLSDVMTPQSFSTVVATLIKYLVYEKQLIPYPYDRLKLYVEKYNELNVQVSCYVCNITGPPRRVVSDTLFFIGSTVKESIVSVPMGRCLFDIGCCSPT